MDAHLVKCIVEVSLDTAIRAGKPVFGTFEVEIDPATLTPEEREALIAAPISRHGPSMTPYHNLSGTFGAPNVPDTSPESIAALLRWHVDRFMAETTEKQTQQARRQQEHDAEVQRYLTTPADALCDNDGDVRGQYSVWQDPRLADKYAEVKAAAQAKKTSYKAKKAEAEAAAGAVAQASAKAKEEIAARKSAQISAWVDAHGTDSQKKRLACGLLPSKEIEDAIRDAAYRPLDTFHRYEKITAQEVCCCEYDHCQVTFRVDDATALTEDEFSTLDQIKTALPAATTYPKVHHSASDVCNNLVTRKSVKVELQVGAFTFTREYSLP